MNVGPAVVVALGAWCDLYSAREDSGGGAGTSFKVREFALLSDGREVTLLDDRGWTTSGRLDRIPITQLVGDVYNTVLPDDAEAPINLGNALLPPQRETDGRVHDPSNWCGGMG